MCSDFSSNCSSGRYVLCCTNIFCVLRITRVDGILLRAVVKRFTKNRSKTEVHTTAVPVLQQDTSAAVVLLYLSM